MVLQINIGRFLKLIRVVPTENNMNFLDSSVYSIIAEYIMKTLYIAGSKPTSSFKGSINMLIMRKMVRYSNSIGVLTNLKKVVKRVFRALTDEDKHDLLDDQILYAPGLSPLRKNLLRNILLINFNMIPVDSTSCIKWMIETYVAEKNKTMSPSFDDLFTTLDEADNKPVHILTKLKEIFLLKRDAKSSKLAKVLYTFFKLRNNIESDAEALLMVANFLHDLNVVSLYKYRVPDRPGLVAINYSKILRVEASAVEIPAVDKKALLERFKEVGQFEGVSRAGVSEDDIVRYLHAMYRYTHSDTRVISVLYDFAYGLFPIRNDSYVKNRQHNLKKFLLKNPADFGRILTRVANWSPDQFTLNERLAQLNDNGITLNDELKDLYVQMMNHDVDEWWNSTVRHEIVNETTSQIFMKVVKNSSAYSTFITRINEWSSSLDGTVAPVRVVSIANEVEPVPEELTSFEPEVQYGFDHADDFNPSAVQPVNELYISSPRETQDSQRFKSSSEPEVTVFNIQSDTSIVVNEPVSPFNLINQQVYEILPEPKEISNVTEKERHLIGTKMSTYRQEPELFDMSDDKFENTAADKIIIESNPVQEEESLQVFDMQIVPTLQRSRISIVFKLKLFTHFTYKLFNPYSARIALYSIYNRPDRDEWNESIKAMINNNVLSTIIMNGSSFSKFNLVVEKTGRFLSHSYVLKSIYRSIDKENLKRVTASKSNANIRGALRPAIEDWTIYMEDMVADGYIEKVMIDNRAYYRRVSL